MVVCFKVHAEFGVCNHAGRFSYFLENPVLDIAENIVFVFFEVTPSSDSRHLAYLIYLHM
jgi:hypothetical protein